MNWRNLTWVFTPAAVLAIGLPWLASATHGGTGNGAPNGPHYNLNIIGVDKGKTADMKNGNGHRIFVDLNGHSKIYLCEAGVIDPKYADGDPDSDQAQCAEAKSFEVIDANATSDDPDRDGGLFALPAPDDNNDGVTNYSVFVRALGTPGGSALISSCIVDPGPDGVLRTDDDEVVCSLGEVAMVDRGNGKVGKFQNVSRELLYVWVDIDGDGDIDRVPLFSDSTRGYLWDYDNTGLRVAQLRFYECSTNVETGDDSSCFGGAH